MRGQALDDVLPLLKAEAMKLLVERGSTLEHIRGGGYPLDASKVRESR